MKVRAHLLTGCSLVIGAALFVFIVKQAGSQELWLRVRSLDARFGWILAVSALRPVLRAYAWLRCLRARERGVGLFNVWRARLIGDAVGNLTTAGPLLAEPARLVFFSAHLPLRTATAALSLEFASYLFSACLMMLAGLALLLATVAVNAALRAVSVALASGLLLFLLVAGLIWWRRWSVVKLLRKVSAHIGSTHRLLLAFTHKLERPLLRLQQLERHSFNFARQRPRDFALVCVCEAGFHALGVLEIWLTLHILGVEAAWLTAFICEAVNRVINFAFAFVPVKLGVDEAGTGWLAVELGFGSLTGVALAVYRKLRVLVWTAVGLLLLLSFYVQRRRAGA